MIHVECRYKIIVIIPIIGIKKRINGCDSRGPMQLQCSGTSDITGMHVARHSIAVNDKDGLASPARVLPDAPGRLALEVDILDKVKILVSRAIFRGDHLLRAPEVEQPPKGPAKQQADPG